MSRYLVDYNLSSHFADIFRYASDGVKRSAGRDATNGTIFGAFSEFLKQPRISRTASSDGCIFTYKELGLNWFEILKYHTWERILKISILPTEGFNDFLVTVRTSHLY